MVSSRHEENLFQTVAELVLSFENGIKRLEAADDADLSPGWDPQHLRSTYTDGLNRIDGLANAFAAPAGGGFSQSKWLHETISKAVRPTAGLDEAPEEAVKSGHRAITQNLDRLIVLCPDDPVRGALEQIKADVEKAGASPSPFAAD